jgi:hypothetical protein
MEYEPAKFAAKRGIHIKFLRFVYNLIVLEYTVRLVKNVIFEISHPCVDQTDYFGFKRPHNRSLYELENKS